MALVLGALGAGIDHANLWGPDEPREAEIARAARVDGNWVTPHLNGLPFLEKPPLYYDLVAAAFALSGVISPAVARGVSALLGAVMLTCVFLFAQRWAGTRRAWISALLLLSTPLFYRCSHRILLDIAVGASCTGALVAFAFHAFWTPDAAHRRRTVALFHLACLCAFLTKGVVGLFHIAVTIGAFCLLTRRWRTARELFSPLPLLISTAPIGLWIALYFREGGRGYLEQLFVHNALGRFLGVDLDLPVAGYSPPDLARLNPWYFYLVNLVVTLGLYLPLLPPALLAALRRVRASAGPPSREGTDGSDVLLYLLIWSVLPVVLLSLSATKGATYVLPSAAGMALLIGAWVDEWLSRRGLEGWEGSGWLWAAAPVVVLTLLAPGLRVGIYLGATLTWLALASLLAVHQLGRRRALRAVWSLPAIALTGVTILNHPEVVRLTKPSFRPLAEEVWSHVGPAPLYLYRPYNDSLRGTLAFVANRSTPEIDREDDLLALLEAPERVFVVVHVDEYAELRDDPRFRHKLALVPLPENLEQRIQDQRPVVLVTNAVRDDG